MVLDNPPLTEKLATSLDWQDKIQGQLVIVSFVNTGHGGRTETLLYKHPKTNSLLS